MDAVKYLEALKRMCAFYHAEKSCCLNCPLSVGNNGTEYGCAKYQTDYPSKAVIIVDEWAREHPIITNREKFVEVFGAISFAAFVWNKLKDGGYDDWWEKEYKAPTSPTKESE